MKIFSILGRSRGWLEEIKRSGQADMSVVKRDFEGELAFRFFFWSLLSSHFDTYMYIHKYIQSREVNYTLYKYIHTVQFRSWPDAPKAYIYTFNRIKS